MKEEKTLEKPEKKEKEIDPLSLDDVPGLGPVSLKALARHGFYTTFQIICKNPTWLKEVTGMDRDKAGDAFTYMKNKLIVAGLISPQEMSASELLVYRESVERIAIGCNALDGLLRGGIEMGCVTEFYGENGAGKTQTSHTLAIQVQRPKAEGGMAEEGKDPPIVLYIDTENTCRPEMMMTILEGKKLISQTPAKIKEKLLGQKVLSVEEAGILKEVREKQKIEGAKYLDNIVVQKVSDALQQMNIIQNAIGLIKTLNVKLIIVDSGTALFRSDYLGRGNTKTKFDLMNEMIHDLKTIAVNGNVAVLFINQIYNKPDEMYGADPDIPYGGNVIGHPITYRIKLSKSGRFHKAKIIKSPMWDIDDVKFDIGEGGIIDVE